MLLDEPPGVAVGGDGGVGLGGEREVDGGLAHGEHAFREPHELDGLQGGDRHLERLGVGIADVLGGEDHHPAQDEAGVLASLEHADHVVDGGVGVGAAHGLDEGGDHVVVLFAGLVVEDGLGGERLLGVLSAYLGASGEAHRRAATSRAFKARRASP